jgi:excisionase family DNA binding protein
LGTQRLQGTNAALTPTGNGMPYLDTALHHQQPSRSEFYPERRGSARHPGEFGDEPKSITDEHRLSLSDAPYRSAAAQSGPLIGGSRSTVYRLLRAGKLRAIKRGTTTLVLTESIDEYMASLPPAIFAADPQAA